jgi:hypothetical protein
VLWEAIDTTKLVDAMSSIIEALQKYFCDKGKANQDKLRSSHINCDRVEKEELDLKEGNHFCVPLERFWINGLLRDLVKLSIGLLQGICLILLFTMTVK